MTGRLAIAAVILSLSGSLLVGSTWRYHELTATAPEPLKAVSDFFFQPWSVKRRIADLTAVRDALERYRADRGSYPASLVFDGRLSRFGASGEVWIAGLAPDYIPRLPVDPRRDGSDIHQYLYMSDGQDYKLISHLPDDLDLAGRLRPDMIDPTHRCQAYGYWTPGAASWFPDPIDPRVTQARLRDLVDLAGCLEAYRLKNGRYPQSQGFDGLYTSWGRSGPDWIPGLVPDFCPSLPRDPRRNDNPANQYLYKSDGANYKLIVHHPEDCPIVRRNQPQLVDPVRGCLAYGIWTDGGRDW